MRIALRLVSAKAGKPNGCRILMLERTNTLCVRILDSLSLTGFPWFPRAAQLELKFPGSNALSVARRRRRRDVALSLLERSQRSLRPD